jgi:hypothetical protein
MAVLCAVVILGINIPLVVLSISSIALLLALLPVVLIATWEYEKLKTNNESRSKQG